MRSIAEYHDLILRLDRLAADAPTRYLWRVGLLAVLGIGFIAAAFVAAAGLVIGVAALVLVSKKFVLIKVAWIPLVFAWMILKAMWVRIPPPEGRALVRREAPRLFDEIEAVRKSVGAQEIHRVVVTPWSFRGTTGRPGTP